MTCALIGAKSRCQVKENLSGLFLEIHFMGEWEWGWEWAWGEWGAEMALGWQ
jgi:hypothetical protein